jgi:hypothetical protein
MRIVEPGPELHEELFALSVARVPQMTRTDAAWQVESPEIWTSLVLRAVLGDDDRPLGWGWTARGAFMPEGWAAVDVTVAREHEAAGVGAMLHAALLEHLPQGTTVLRCSTYDVRRRRSGAGGGPALGLRGADALDQLPAPARPRTPRGGRAGGGHPRVVDVVESGTYRLQRQL